MESTIVQAIRQSKSQVVVSHRRRRDVAFEVVFGPRLRRGLDHAAASLRSAALARSSKQASKQKEEKEGKKDEGEKMGKKKGAQK